MPQPYVGFWQENAGDRPLLPAFTGQETGDVAICGAGFTGLATAIQLKEKKPHLRVMVVEKERVGWGASGRNAGFAMRLFGLSLETTVLLHGREKTQEADQYMREAVNHVRNVITKYDLKCDFIERGMMTVASTPGELRQLEKEMELAEKMNLPGFTWLEGERARDRVDSPSYRAARFDEHAALLHPARLVRELLRTALDKGVEVYEGSPVLEVDLKRKIFHLPGGEIRAHALLLATNAYSGFVPYLHRRQLPIFTYIALTEPLPPSFFEETWKAPIGIEDARNYLHYYRPTPDGRLLFGGGDALYYYGGDLHRASHPSLYAYLQEKVRRVFPQLEKVTFTHHWGGPISATLDLIPALGAIAPDVYYSMGCVGHGVSLTQYNGLTLAELILGEDTSRTGASFVNRKVRRIPGEPLRTLVAGGIRRFLRYQDLRGERR
ncbi:MAG: FAD-dependent oxidoreductase [Bacillota bacterium]|nr:FAD-dependent oxidoreductase [Bacillota bacterium]